MPPDGERTRVNRLLAFIGMTIGGWIGWEIGSAISFFAAFIVSIVGTAAGLYMVNRFIARYL